MVCDLPLHFDYAQPVAMAFVSLSAAAQDAGPCSAMEAYPFVEHQQARPPDNLVSRASKDKQQQQQQQQQQQPSSKGQAILRKGQQVLEA